MTFQSLNLIPLRRLYVDIFREKKLQKVLTSRIYVGTSPYDVMNVCSTTQALQSLEEERRPQHQGSTATMSRLMASVMGKHLMLLCTRIAALARRQSWMSSYTNQPACV